MRRGVLVLLCMLCVACGSGRQADEVRFVGTDITGALLGAQFRLTDHRGQVRQLADFRGKLVALFFGYTHCPDVCPTTMSDLAQAVRLLGARGKEVQVLFVTLDPERDTPQVLAQYVPAFNPDFLGLYGDVPTTVKTAQDFKVFFSKQASSSKAGYSIDHSAGVYVFDKAGKLRLFVNFGQKAKDIAHDLELLL